MDAARSRRPIEYAVLGIGLCLLALTSVLALLRRELAWGLAVVGIGCVWTGWWQPRAGSNSGRVLGVLVGTLGIVAAILALLGKVPLALPLD